jgi:hypothetical protein
VGAQFGMPFPPPNVAGPFALDHPDLLTAPLRDGGLEAVEAHAVATPMTAASLDEWWERVPQLAGPLAMALAGMEPEVRDAIRRRSLDFAEAAVRHTGVGIVLDGAVLIAAGRRPA